MRIFRKDELADPIEFFRVLESTDLHQLALMDLEEGQVSGDFGTDHPRADQVVYVLEGAGKARVDEETVELRRGDLLVIPAGKKHQIVGPNRTLNFYAPVAYPEEAS